MSKYVSEFNSTGISILSIETIEKSVTYSYVQPWGPKAINGFATIIPLFKDMFAELEQFFDGVAKQISLR